ncbi:MAG: ribosomal protein S18-alanine N-acetyltransferase [Chloroflexi bacterium]|nr:ribosomal protein S18-alanine N-acetyltransferase [Chloroflexota bacterium]
MIDLSGTSYTLSPMTLDDVQTVHTIEEEIYTAPWSLGAFVQEVRDNRSAHYLVLRYKPYEYEPFARRMLPRGLRHHLNSPHNDPAILGYGGFWLYVDEAHICTLALRESWRGRGLGELLLNSLLDAALKQGAAFATLEVRVSNLRAQGLYGKYGFRTVGRRVGYYTDNHEDAYIMSTESLQDSAYQALLAAHSQALQERLDADEAARSGSRIGS